MQMISRDQKIYRVTLTGSIVNMILLVMKFVAGILGNSAAMIADAVHSLSDFLTDIVVIALVKLSSKIMTMVTESMRPLLRPLSVWHLS